VHPITTQSYHNRGDGETPYKPGAGSGEQTTDGRGGNCERRENHEQTAGHGICGTTEQPTGRATVFTQLTRSARVTAVAI
jgi:hypothetical protein